MLTEAELSKSASGFLLTLIIPGGRNYHPLSENRDFSGTDVALRCGPGEKNQSALSFSVEAWRPDEVREQLFPNSEIEIFIDFCRFSTNFTNFQKILRGPV